MQECLMKCICCICVEEFQLAHNQKLSYSKLDKGGIAYNWLPQH